MPEDLQQRLIIFTRYPEAGTAKTRMIPELGAKGAAEQIGRASCRERV